MINYISHTQRDGKTREPSRQESLGCTLKGREESRRKEREGRKRGCDMFYWQSWRRNFPARVDAQWLAEANGVLFLHQRFKNKRKRKKGGWDRIWLFQLACPLANHPLTDTAWTDCQEGREVKSFFFEFLPRSKVTWGRRWHRSRSTFGSSCRLVLPQNNAIQTIMWRWGKVKINKRGGNTELKALEECPMAPDDFKRLKADPQGVLFTFYPSQKLNWKKIGRIHWWKWYLNVTWISILPFV